MTNVRSNLKWIILWVFIFASAYLFLRLFNLSSLPIFTDEAIYVRWSQIGSRDANWRFISLVDGKQPLYTWIAMVLMRLVDDPLIAGRLVSVLAGAASLVGMWFLGIEVSRSNRVATIAAFLYLISPFALLYDRMALYDSLSATFYIWSLLLALRYASNPRLDTAFILGMVLGGGVLNKTSGFLSLYLLPSTLLVFDWKSAHLKKRLIAWGGGLLVAAVLSQAMYSILRLSPLFHMIKQKDGTFVYTFGEWLQHPFTFLVGNLKGLFDWLIHYLTWPIFIGVFGAFFGKREYWKKILLFVWWLAPFVALGLFGKVLYPRYILFMAMPLLVLASFAIDYIYSKYGRTILGIACLSVVVFPSLIADFYILTNAPYAPIPEADKGQYLNNWPAGWGAAEVNALILERSKYGKVSIYTEGTFGLFPYAIEIYLVDKPNIAIHGIWPLPEEMPEEMYQDALDHETYFVLNQSQEPPSWPMQQIAEYQKGIRKDRKLRLYKIIP